MKRVPGLHFVISQFLIGNIKKSLFSLSIHDEIPPFYLMWEPTPLILLTTLQTSNRIIFFHIPFLIAPFLHISKIRSTQAHTDTHAYVNIVNPWPALYKKKLQSENLFIHIFIKYFLFARLFFMFCLHSRLRCWPNRPTDRPTVFPAAVRCASAVECETTPSTHHRYVLYLTDTYELCRYCRPPSRFRRFCRVAFYSRVCFALGLHPSVRFALGWILLTAAGWPTGWLASTVVGKNIFQACSKPSTSAAAASGQQRRRDVSARYEYPYSLPLLYLLLLSACVCVCVVCSLHRNNVNFKASARCYFGIRTKTKPYRKPN